MEAKDLMIGDWVIDGKNIAQITSITCDGIIETTFNKSSNIEVIEPIPLTPAILEKNDFIGMPYAVLKIDDDSWLEYYYHEHRLIKWWSGIDEWENHSKVKDITFQCHCIYVHELQHALKMCGIKKEVNL